MNLCEAHAAFAVMCDKGDDLDHLGIATDQPTAPLLAAALASCSGWLSDASTDEQLLQALEHGWQLFESGIIDASIWAVAVGDVAHALEAQVGPQAVSELN